MNKKVILMILDGWGKSTSRILIFKVISYLDYVNYGSSVNFNKFLIAYLNSIGKKAMAWVLMVIHLEN